jgi:hypothetical protein
MAFLSGSIRKAQGQMGRSSYAPGRSLSSIRRSTGPRGTLSRAVSQPRGQMGRVTYGNRGFSGTGRGMGSLSGMRAGGFGGALKPMRSGSGFTRQLGTGPTGGFKSARMGKYGRKFGGRCG